MTQSRRKAAAVLAVAGAMTAETPARANVQSIPATDSRERTIVVRVANYPDLPRQILDGAKARVERVYAGIGVRIVWIRGEDPLKSHQDGRLHLTVILLSNDMARKKIAAQRIAKHVLGQAHLASWRAYIFCDRIAAVPGAPTLFPLSLGNVIAHEMGHLLLRENRHSRTGLMRANAELDAIHLKNFDTSQANRIRTMLLEPSSAQ
jgi:hypothetical protein